MKKADNIFRDEEATQQREITRFIFHEGGIFFRLKSKLEDHVLDRAGSSEIHPGG